MGLWLSESCFTLPGHEDNGEYHTCRIFILTFGPGGSQELVSTANASPPFFLPCKGRVAGSREYTTDQTSGIPRKKALWFTLGSIYFSPG